MLALLCRLKAQDLHHIVGSERITTLKRLLCDPSLEKSADILKLARFILAVYGYDLLYDKGIRRLLFTLIEPVLLKKFAEKFANKSYEKPYDNALALSRCQWKSGSRLVWEIARELNIPKEYLPLRTNTYQAVELIEPNDKLLALHDYQKELKAKILFELENTTQRFLIQMPTGAGKTRTVIEALSDFIVKEDLFHNQQSILWLAHTEELCEQAIDTFKDVWQNRGNHPAQVVRCWGSYNPNLFDMLGGFIVGTLQKLYALRQRHSDEFACLSKSSRIIIIDEAHKAIAPSYSKVVDDLCSVKKSLIGITATPGRSATNTKENQELARFFHRNLISPNFSENPIHELREKKILAKVNRKIIQTEITVELKNEDFSEFNTSFELSRTIIRYLAKNTERNRIILDLIRDEINRGNPCLVFSCSIDHSRLLTAALNFEDYSAGYVDYSLRKGSRKRVIESFRNGDMDVLFNYGVLSTGFDAPRIRTVIITRPTASVVLYSQMIGRGLRGPLMGGAEFCNLIDIKDNYLNFGGIEEVYTFFEEYWDKS